MKAMYNLLSILHFSSVFSVVLACTITFTDDKGVSCMSCGSIQSKIVELEKQVASLKSQNQSSFNKGLFGRKNIALKKKCDQKTSGSIISYAAENAVDGDLSTFSHTTHVGNKNGVNYGTSNPYWWVDLGQVFKVKRVDIYNRNDCCGDRMRDLEVTVGKTLENMKFCASYKGPAFNGELVILTCQKPTEARYVKLMIMDENPKETYLHPAEVEVYE